MNTNLKAIQRKLKRLSAAVEEKKENVQHAKDALVSLQKERTRVEHVLANLPHRLPSNAPPARQPQPVPEPEAAVSSSGVAEAAPVAAPAAARTAAAPTIALFTVAEFESVPQYMRGRITRDQAIRTLDEVNTVVKARYSLVRRPRTKLPPNERRLWVECRREETATTKGKMFFTEDDFQRFNKTAMSKAQRQLLVILRHCGRTNTERGPGKIVRHVLI